MGAVDAFSGVLPFVTVAEERSFRRAAARLGVTTAAVSKAVARLEEELGVMLLQRTSRSVSLTPEGEAFLGHGRLAVREALAAREVVMQSQRAPQGEIKVTLPFVLASTVVRALPELAARHPRLAFRLAITDRTVALADEGIDVAVRIGRLPDSSLVARALRTPRWVTCASPAYLARRGTPARPEDLGTHACIKFVTPRGALRQWSFVDATAPPGAVLVVDQGTLLVEAARAGLGVCQAFDFMVEDDLRAGRLVEVLAAFSTASEPVHALSLPRRASSPKVRAFLDFLVTTLGPRSEKERTGSREDRKVY
jgi:DNA-binding transcriptional LysR family regulator